MIRKVNKNVVRRCTRDQIEVKREVVVVKNLIQERKMFPIVHRRGCRDILIREVIMEGLVVITVLSIAEANLNRIVEMAVHRLDIEVPSETWRAGIVVGLHRLAKMLDNEEARVASLERCEGKTQTPHGGRKWDGLGQRLVSVDIVGGLLVKWSVVLKVNAGGEI